jgi:large subunit ribosomal protein L18
LIDDVNGKVILSASSAKTEGDKKKQKKIEKSEAVGKLLAVKAKEKGIARVVFDRRGYKFHGRVKALADSAKKEGLKI